LSSLSHQGTPTPGNSSDATSTAVSETQRRQHGPSEYELRREANIAENKRLLDSLGLSKGGSSAILDGSPANVKRNKGEKEKGKRYVFCLFCTAYPSMI
jgi:hypothetical protein